MPVPSTAGNDHWSMRSSQLPANTSSPSSAKDITSGAENAIYVRNPRVFFVRMHVGARGKLPAYRASSLNLIDASHDEELAGPHYRYLRAMDQSRP
jgi:hypothetical protein